METPQKQDIKERKLKYGGFSLSSFRSQDKDNDAETTPWSKDSGRRDTMESRVAKFLDDSSRVDELLTTETLPVS